MLATAEQTVHCAAAVRSARCIANVHAQSCQNWFAKVMYMHSRKSALPPYAHAMQISENMHFRETE